VAAQAGRVPPQGLRTIRELPVVLEERTLFLDRALRMQKEVTGVLVPGQLTERLVRRTEVTVAVAVMATQLQMAATVVRE
jgi:hypothetical protein